jgi:hypothetical protein
MRESQTLRDALNTASEDSEDERREKSLRLANAFFLSFTDKEFLSLIRALQRAGFPKPWKRLSQASQTKLVLLLAKSKKGAMRGDKTLYPPVVIEETSPEFDQFENQWRFGPSEPRVLNGWDRSGRLYFWGFIRIDRAYNEMEAFEAFQKEFSKRWEKTKGGNRDWWQAKLNDLVVLRLWKQFPKKPIERVEHVAKFATAGFKGCKDFWEQRCQARHEKRYVEQRISNAAKVEMSRARAKARTFFQSLFPGEDPLSWQWRKSAREKVNSN